ncbi:arsenate reductase (thioredoxin) [Periweissella fabalis]|uniref:Arsenate reductase n=1 Tax=Periweissella fabalis TaxID=1070421 RepID=A0A7X6S307_9LACO|nr:arsenate reductase (thioredoxin) [Periweissella fabalis]MCM0599397.1 arsenate reductase (thioredoxin) [Periweissella fabalis]NKZ23676.1 arsenate reductase (thioredoxin) [Periweissella fabalis]
MNKKSLYFLCTGNSCRSQMAEAWAHKYLNAEEWDIKSAGIEAHGLNPLTIKAMAEVNIDVSNYSSDIIDDEYLMHADLVVTLCGDANDRCPITPINVVRLHWEFSDPAQATGTPEQQWHAFQDVRDAIGNRIKAFSETGI